MSKVYSDEDVTPETYSDSEVTVWAKQNVNPATGKAMEGSRDANGVYSGPSLIMRTSAANRQWLRSLGTGKDGGDEYMTGLDNPSKVETFQNQLLRTGIIPDPKGTTSVLNSFAGGVAGEMADVMTGPQALLTAAGDINMNEVPGAFKAMVGKGGIIDSTKNTIKGIGEFLTRPSALEELMTMKNQIIEGAKDFLGGNKDVTGAPVTGVIDAAHEADTAAANAKYTGLKTSKAAELDNLVKAEIPKVADQTTIENRENYVKLAQDVSDRFGEAYNKAVGNSTIDITDLHDALGNAAQKAGLMDKPEAAWSPSEAKIMDYYKKLSASLPSSEPTLTTDPLLGTISTPPAAVELPVSKVDQDLQRILQSKAGKKYGSGDHILTLVREEMANMMPENDAIKIVRSKFKPLLQMKNEAYNIFQPFNRSGEFDTTRGINFFSRYANGGLKPDEVRFVQSMQRKFGPDVFKGMDDIALAKQDMMKQLTQLDHDHQGTLAGIQAAHDDARATILSKTENQLAPIDAQIAKEKKNQVLKKVVGIGAVAGAGALIDAGGRLVVDKVLKK